jgi:hypothetical protein
MKLWSVRWTLDEAHIPAEIERRRKIFPEDTEERIQREARWEKSRSFDTRPPADDFIRRLKPISSEVRLIRFNEPHPNSYPLIWNRPTPDPVPMNEDPTRLISGTTADGNPYHQIGDLLVQRNARGEWHAFDRCIWQDEFRTEQSAKRWLKKHAPTAKKFLPPRLGALKDEPSSPPTDQPLTNDLTMKSNIDPATEFPSSSSTAHSALGTSHSPQAFHFRTYQKDDLARAAMHDGAIIAWDPGMGKTMAIYALPFLKQARRVLIVAPAGLHEQIMDEGREKFGIEVTPIPNQEAAYALMREGKLPVTGGSASGEHTEPQFFITAYNWLGYNGGDEWHSEETNEIIRARRLMVLHRSATFPDAHLARKMADLPWKTKDRVSDWQALSIPADSPPAKIRTALRTAAMLFHPSLHPGDPDMHWRWQRIFKAATACLNLSPTAADKLEVELAADPAVLETCAALRSIEQGIGHEKDGIKCVFRPTLASIVTTAFDFIICDEAVRLKSGTAYIAQGVLRMDSRCRYALTGTPIKNKLPDFFFLASWVTGHTADAIARWPYGNTTQDRGQFGRDFGVIEENLTKAEIAEMQGKKAPPPKTTNQICNVHRLWRILGPVLIRRRKDAVPECDIVTKTIVPIRVMPGAEQKRVYKFHLDHAPEHDSILASIGAQLQNLRQAALNPCSFKLTHGGKDGRSQHIWTPKLAAILQLATDLLAKREQVVIFSPFQDFSDNLAARFADAGIKHLVLDGKTTPEKRGSLIKRFKSREIPILIAGIDSMGEGYSLDNASHLILPSLSWAFDSNTQAVERVHRLTSKKPVTIYCMVTQGTIDERLAAIWQEKGDSSDLALDGRLSTQDRDEIDLGTLLRDAVKDFDPKAPSLCELEIATNWRSTLKPALTAADAIYVAGASCSSPSREHPAPSTKTETPKTRSLFDLMKNKRPTPPPASNVIPFTPAAKPPARPLAMPKVNIAELLRKSATR